jgi:hypothetical protein
MVITLVPVFRTRPLAMRHQDETVHRRGDRLMPGTVSVYTTDAPETHTASDTLYLCSCAQDNGHGSLPV